MTNAFSIIPLRGGLWLALAALLASCASTSESNGELTAGASKAVGAVTPTTLRAAPAR